VKPAGSLDQDAVWQFRFLLAQSKSWSMFGAFWGEQQAAAAFVAAACILYATATPNVTNDLNVGSVLDCK
jgi:hypothetical protein